MTDKNANSFTQQALDGKLTPPDEGILNGGESDYKISDLVGEVIKIVSAVETESQYEGSITISAQFTEGGPEKTIFCSSAVIGDQVRKLVKNRALPYLCKIDKQKKYLILRDIE